MASPSQALVLKFSTDLAAAQNNIARFATQTALSLDTIGKRAIQAKDAIDFLGRNATNIKIGGAIAASALAAVAALAVFSAAVRSAEEALDRLNKIGTGAAKAGVGTTFFQSYTQQAKELNLEVSDLTAQLEKFREASTTSIGEDGGLPKNAGRDRIQQNILAGYLGPSALSSFNAADTGEARLRVVLGLLDELKAKGLRLAEFDLGKTFFGASFETQLRNGVDAIGNMRKSLDGTSAAGGARIISKEEIQNAQKMQEELNEINNRLAKASAPLLQEIARWQQNILQYTIDWKAELVRIVELIDAVLPTIENIASAVSAMAAGALSLGFSAEDDILRGKRQDEKAAPFKPGLLGLRGAALSADRSSESLPSLTPKTAPAASRAAATDQVETYINSLKKLAAAEAAEAATLGLGNKAKQEAIDLARAQEAAAERKTPLTAKEISQVKSLADAYVDAKKKIEDFTRSQEQAKAAAEFFGQTLEGAISGLVTGTGSLKSALRDIVKLLEQAAIKALLLGEGPLAGLFGTAAPAGATGTAAIGGIFGGLFNLLPKLAEGGILPAGRFGIAGERGPELIQGPAAITPFRQINAALDSGAAARSSPFTYRPVFQIDARGAQAGVDEKIVAALKQYDSQLDRNLPSRLAIANRRFS